VTAVASARRALDTRLRACLDQLPHLVFFLLVAGALAHLVAVRSDTCVPILVLSLLVSLVYGAGLMWWARLGPRGRLIWLAVLVMLWLLLTTQAPGILPYAYVWCAVPLACLAVRALGPRAAAAAVAVITTLMVAVLLGLPGPAQPDLIVAPIVAAWATAGLYAAQRRETLTRQRLIDELQAARGALAEQQRTAGALAERTRIACDLHDAGRLGERP